MNAAVAYVRTRGPLCRITTGRFAGGFCRVIEPSAWNAPPDVVVVQLINDKLCGYYLPLSSLEVLP